METEPLLWSVPASGHERRPVGRPYWWPNQHRRPANQVVVQYTIAGHVAYRDPAGEAEVGPGSVMLFAFGEPSVYGRLPRHHDVYECRWLNLAGAGLREHWAALRRRFGSVIDLGGDKSIEQELIEIARMTQPDRALPPTEVAHAVHRLVMRLFEAGESRQAADRSPVLQAVEHILRHPTLTESLKEIAARHGCSREHLCRVFHERVGKPAGTFLAEAKLEHAIRLLAATDLPVSAVARQSGFASAHSLRRRLAQRRGVAPTQLRAMRRRG